MNSVRPSGFAWTTASAAIIPEAPGLLSTMVCMPRFDISAAMART
jgi:hypothetical protein